MKLHLACRCPCGLDAEEQHLLGTSLEIRNPLDWHPKLCLAIKSREVRFLKNSADISDEGDENGDANWKQVNYKPHQEHGGRRKSPLIA